MTLHVRGWEGQPVVRLYDRPEGVWHLRGHLEEMVCEGVRTRRLEALGVGALARLLEREAAQEGASK